MLLLMTDLLVAQEREFLAEQFIQEGDTLNYRILYPEGFSEDKEYPLVLFLHGAGERGSEKGPGLRGRPFNGGYGYL